MRLQRFSPYPLSSPLFLLSPARPTSQWSSESRIILDLLFDQKSMCWFVPILAWSLQVYFWTCVPVITVVIIVVVLSFVAAAAAGSWSYFVAIEVIVWGMLSILAWLNFYL
ncbi:unnamed protein product [Malus baccata var. baccata]